MTNADDRDGLNAEVDLSHSEARGTPVSERRGAGASPAPRHLIQQVRCSAATTF